ncbi:DNA-binding transcriptional regulator, LacI/PurR family [Parafrankia irregularis]|uniref:DNA-binding transcriptional regulator, LacI/PurR family n=1 Tax=Parafrankia irregularis TaxID=795642 RepID=A0A0S4QYQ9_9ACTN|nr:MULTISPECIES: LacI family DNA-binding transcriptional regulator [Parafrankia]MBE3203541.1 LacI family DNA-binding transcriptional regulator [Parafrankia sp. CH37]CUU60436.1 DNA-binding transcriptional regulator, LacI/PurR family [Parafrankia irregularis]
MPVDGRRGEELSRLPAAPGPGPGPSRPTSADVARHAGVSRATVSHVLNGTDHPVSEQTRQRVLAAARDLQYAPNASARALRAGRSNIVLVPMLRSATVPGADRFLESLDRELAARDLVLLMHGDRTTSGVRGAQAWAELRPAAVYVNVSRGTPAAVELLRRAGVQAVLLTGAPRVDYAPTVPLDPAAVARLATRHLLARGCRRLACLVPSGPLAELPTQRYEAVMEVAAADGVPVERVDCELSSDSIAPVVDRWRDPAQRPDAVYTNSDPFAILLIDKLRAAGIEVPRDIAVVGSGDHPLGAALRPAITTATFDVPAIARVVASSIRRLLDGADLDPGLEAALRPHLIVRESG